MVKAAIWQYINSIFILREVPNKTKNCLTVEASYIKRILSAPSDGGDKRDRSAELCGGERRPPPEAA